jgi:hypothetical protein
MSWRALAIVDARSIVIGLGVMTRETEGISMMSGVLHRACRGGGFRFALPEHAGVAPASPAAHELRQGT